MKNTAQIVCQTKIEEAINTIFTELSWANLSAVPVKEETWDALALIGKVLKVDIFDE